MIPNVSVEMGSFEVALFTVRTGVVSLAHVRFHVVVQITIEVELLVANITLEFRLLVNSHFVMSQLSSNEE